MGKQHKRVADNPSETNYKLWGMFHKAVLPAIKNQREDTKSAAKRTMSRLERWEKGRYLQVWEETVSLREKTNPTPRRGRKRQQPRNPDTRTQAEFNADRAKTLGSMGQYSRAMETLGSLGMAAPSPETADILRDKHPPGNNTHIPRDVDTEAVSFTSGDVAKGLKRFKKGSAPGLDGQRAEHIWVAVGNLNSRRESCS